MYSTFAILSTFFPAKVPLHLGGDAELKDIENNCKKFQQPLQVVVIGKHELGRDRYLDDPTILEQLRSEKEQRYVQGPECQMPSCTKGLGVTVHICYVKTEKVDETCRKVSQ